MRKNNISTSISIFFVRNIWHGQIGRKFNKKNGIICRFYPSCSNYAIMALEKYGFIRGWSLTFNRIKRCTNNNTETCIDYP